MLKIVVLTVALVTLASAPLAHAGGAAHGVVRFADDYPEAETIKMTQDFDVCGLKKPDQTFVVSAETKGLQNAVITIVGATGDGPAVSGGSIHQKECVYGPRVQVMRPGTELEFVNEDPLLHNVHAYQDEETLFNMAHPKYRKVLKKSIDASGVVLVKCDVHPWMTAYVIVSDDSFVAVTDADGAYRFEGVPAGTYTVRLWHEALGTTEKQVTITEDGDAAVDFIIGE